MNNRDFTFNPEAVSPAPRRRVLKAMALAGAAWPLASLTGCASVGGKRPQVVVVGAGWGGSTAAKYLRLIRGRVASIDATQRQLKLEDGQSLGYDKLVLAPGVDMMWNNVQGLQAAHAEGRILHAWKAGAETVALRRQLEAMRDGGTYAIVIPEAPYRCPPGPYERASVVAAYFKREKPRSKVLILDGNPDVTSKGPLFKKAWAEIYGPMLEYRSQHKAVAVDARSNTVKFEVQDDVRADVLNVLPPMRAGQRQCALVPCGFSQLRIHRGPARARDRRFDPGGTGHAQVGAHGQFARQGDGGSADGRTAGSACQCTPDADQRLHELRRRQPRDPRRQRARVRADAEDLSHRRRIGWCVRRALRPRGGLHAGLGAQHLG